MLKIGIIGLGDIAQKAYLPIISRKKVELHLYTRNEATLKQIGEQYQLKNLHQSLEALIASGITAAFVHAATAAHYGIVEQLLDSNIHVCVDKPVTCDYSSTEKLVRLAEKKGLVLSVGFNRRFAPAYRKLKELPDPNMIILQKNRKSLPGDVRAFVFEDFIHVVDTLLYLFPHPIKKMLVSGKKKGSMLYHIIVQLTSADGASAIGIMNRDSGTIEEKIEVFTSSEKWVVRNVSDVVIHQDKHAKRLADNDWESTLVKRGFDQMVDAFLQAVSSPELSKTVGGDILATHKICEEIVNELQVI